MERDPFTLDMERDPFTLDMDRDPFILDMERDPFTLDMDRDPKVQSFNLCPFLTHSVRNGPSVSYLSFFKYFSPIITSKQESSHILSQHTSLPCISSFLRSICIIALVLTLTRSSHFLIIEGIINIIKRFI